MILLPFLGIKDGSHIDSFSYSHGPEHSLMISDDRSPLNVLMANADIAAFFENLSFTKNIVLENAFEISHAIEWYKLGADFADAMHLCMCGESILHTFDNEFCKAANRLGITPHFKILK